MLKGIFPLYRHTLLFIVKLEFCVYCHTVIFYFMSGSNCNMFSLKKFEMLKMFLGCSLLDGISLASRPPVRNLSRIAFFHLRNVVPSFLSSQPPAGPGRWPGSSSGSDGGFFLFNGSFFPPQSPRARSGRGLDQREVSVCWFL